MTKYEYLSKLEKSLKFLGEEEISDIMIDYEEHFLNEQKNGKSDDQIIYELGSPEEVAKRYTRSGNDFIANNDYENTNKNIHVNRVHTSGYQPARPQTPPPVVRHTANTNNLNTISQPAANDYFTGNQQAAEVNVKKSNKSIVGMVFATIFTILGFAILTFIIGLGFTVTGSLAISGVMQIIISFSAFSNPGFLAGNVLLGFGILFLGLFAVYGMVYATIAFIKYIIKYIVRTVKNFKEVF